MKKTLSLIIALAMVFCLAVPALAIGGEMRVQLIHIIPGDFATQTCGSYATLEEAAANAQDGDVIELIADAELTAPVVFDGISVKIVSGTKREKQAITGESMFVYTDENAEKRTITQTFDGTAFTVKGEAEVTFENVKIAGKADNTAKKGGIVYVDDGATFNTVRGVEFAGSALGETGTYGGAIFFADGSKGDIKEASFSGNSAADGDDIYVCDKADVLIDGTMGALVGTGEPEEETPAYTPGDLDGDGEVTDGDAVYLLFYTFFPEDYPIEQPVDYDGDGEITDDDAVYLLFYTFFPEDYPLS